jgi:hypothetical protein
MWMTTHLSEKKNHLSKKPVSANVLEQWLKRCLFTPDETTAHEH